MTDCREGSATWATALRSLGRLGGSAAEIASVLIPPLSHADVILWDKPWGAKVPQPEIPHIARLPFQRTYFDFGSSHYRTALKNKWLADDESWRVVGGILAQSSQTDNAITGVPFIWAEAHQGFSQLMPAGSFVWRYSGIEDRSVEFKANREFFLHEGKRGAEVAVRSSVERMLEILTLLACVSIEVAPLDLNRAARKRIQRSRNGKAAHVVVLRTRRLKYAATDNPQVRLDKMAAHNVIGRFNHVTCGPYFNAHPDKQWTHPTKGLGVSMWIAEHQRGEGTATPRIRRFAVAQ